jgi:hypothetical protein
MFSPLGRLEERIDTQEIFVAKRRFEGAEPTW